MPRGFLVKRQDSQDSEERNDPLDLTRKSSSVQLSAARDQLRREGKILSAPVWRPAIADDCKIDAKPKPADVRSSCEDSSPTPDVVTSGTEVVSLEAALRWYHQRLPFLTAPGANLYPTLPFASSFHFYPHYASLLMPPVISQTASPVSPVPVPTPSPETYSDGLDLSVKSSHGQLSSPVNRESATSHTAPSTGSKKSTQSSVACTPSSEAKKRPNDSKVEVLSNKKSRACGSSKRQKAARKLSFDDELISPVSGTIIKDASEMEDGMVVCPGDIDPAFNLVEVTEEARAELAKIENRIGDYVCRLCRVLYEDAFGLAQHRCPRIVHVEYRCPECDKVFNCPANLASHRRWHKPRQQGSNPKNSSASGAAQSKAENQASSRSGLSLINNNNHKDKTSDTVLLARHLLNFAKGNLQNACNYPTNPVTGYSFTSSEHLRSVSPATSSQDSSQQTSPLRLIQAPQVRAAT